ncbi:WXG100 family type VII secretion target [Streptomyces sp. NPDC057950]|uniref:WXG100 family type VII secretion target n=1 Tax=Streptomyces sp. NPDC057950 TaxID=3346288 RepID=UPI0036EF1D1C
MPGSGTGGSTSFEHMTHEQMLQWLDQANSGMVRSAADRLHAAAREIRKIAEELKVRPQWVEWKGEGADAFRLWTGDLANATLRLGDFGADSATWLGHASDAIAQAQASIPRDKAGAQANLDAATAAHNDPDAATVSRRSTTELAALAADREKIREEAAAQMTKLGQAYRLSATQLDGLERPKFPPPPKALQPKGNPYGGDEVVSSGTNGTDASSNGGEAVTSPPTGSGQSAVTAVGNEEMATDDLLPHDPPELSLPRVSDHVGVQIDGTGELPRTPAAHSESLGSLPIGDRGEAVQSLSAGVTGTVPGAATGPSSSSSRAGRSTFVGRPPVQPRFGTAGPVSAGPPGVGGATAQEGATNVARPVVGGRPAMPPERGATASMPGRTPGNDGIVGGRPAASPAGSAAGRAAGRVPRGTVIGGETSSPTGRGSSTRRTPASTGRAGFGQSGVPVDRRDVGAVAERGVVGGRPQAQRRVGAKPFTSGGSGLVRGLESSDDTPAACGAGSTGTQPDNTRSSRSRQNTGQDGKTSDRGEKQEPERQSDDSGTGAPTIG